MAPSLSTIDQRMVQRALSASLVERQVAVLHQGLDGRYDFVENLSPHWPQADLIGRSDDDVLPSAVASQFADARQMAIDRNAPQIIDFELRIGARNHQFEARFSADRDAHVFVGITIIITDVSDLRARELALATLMREVSHRSKNLLAIVQSVAAQTAHNSGGVEDFLVRFRGRLQSLASTQDMVTESNWRGTLFQSLVSAQMARVGQADPADIRVTGDNPLLSPNAAMHIGLAMHELAINAVMHGALAEPGRGAIWIDAQIHQADPQNAEMVVQWQETGAGHLKPPAAPHFGRLVLDRIVPASVGGSARYVIDDDLVSYRLVVPADQFEA
ncbi:HWE histidine kinase domain-containing protein [Devosia sp.]|uniref:sensor histidine kinase n=1 Tax=Devosia sp. TaxID=1871048 RepID=UPI0032631CEE